MNWWENLIKVCTTRGGGSTDHRETMEWISLESHNQSRSISIPPTPAVSKLSICDDKAVETEEFEVLVAPLARTRSVKQKQPLKRLDSIKKKEGRVNDWIDLTPARVIAHANTLENSTSRVKQLVYAYERGHELGEKRVPRYIPRPKAPIIPPKPSKMAELQATGVQVDSLAKAEVPHQAVRSDESWLSSISCFDDLVSRAEKSRTKFYKTTGAKLQNRTNSYRQRCWEEKMVKGRRVGNNYMDRPYRSLQ